MQHPNVDAIRANPQSRISEYKPMVTDFYEQVTDLFLSNWGASFHLALFRDGLTPETATEALELSLAEEGGFAPGMQILDVGCGVGGPTLTIARHSGAHLTGINITLKQVEIARKRTAEAGMADRVRFEHGDAMNMPFADGTYDAVYLFESGYHMPDKPRFVKECARVLKPGGIFLGYDWMAKDGYTPEEHVKYIEPLCRRNSAPYLATPSQLRGWLEAAGLSVETCVDARTLGDLSPNWDLIDQSSAEMRAANAPDIPPHIQLLTAGGDAITAAGRAGIFTLGHWRARKPN